MSIVVVNHIFLPQNKVISQLDPVYQYHCNEIGKQAKSPKAVAQALYYIEISNFTSRLKTTYIDMHIHHGSPYKFKFEYL